MSYAIPLDDDVTYRLVLVLPDSHRIVAESNGPRVLLPRLAIPKGTRPAREIQKGIQLRWNLPALVLDCLPDSQGFPICVVELFSSLAPQGLIDVALDQLRGSELTTEELTFIKAICTGDAGERGPFSRIGWIEEAKQWIQEETAHAVPFSGEVEQHNASSTFALVRFGTQCGPDYWLKATGEPNLHELSITALLAELCPTHLPELVATRPDWNAWAMRDAGEPIDQSVQALERAVASMAALQKETIDHTQDFMAVGATDQRIIVLRDQVSGLISYLEEAMEQQTSTKVPRIGASRLREIGRILEDACNSMDELHIPDTVIHNDISRRNILVRNNTCVFTDWCEAYVGNPFMTLQHLRLLLPRDADHSEVADLNLKKAYRQNWLDSLAEWQIDQAFALMPLLAIASYLYGRGDWLQSARRYEPHMQKYARSLARYMDRAAQTPLLMEALCH